LVGQDRHQARDPLFRAHHSFAWTESRFAKSYLSGGCHHFVAVFPVFFFHLGRFVCLTRGVFGFIRCVQTTWKLLVRLGLVSPQNIMRAGRDAASAASSSPELSAMTGALVRAGIQNMDVTLATQMISQTVGGYVSYSMRDDCSNLSFSAYGRSAKKKLLPPVSAFHQKQTHPVIFFWPTRIVLVYRIVSELFWSTVDVLGLGVYFRNVARHKHALEERDQQRRVRPVVTHTHTHTHNTHLAHIHAHILTTSTMIRHTYMHTHTHTNDIIHIYIHIYAYTHTHTHTHTLFVCCTSV
jgi:hypothetical protein